MRRKESVLLMDNDPRLIKILNNRCVVLCCVPWPREKYTACLPASDHDSRSDRPSDLHITGILANQNQRWLHPVPERGGLLDLQQTTPALLGSSQS